MTPWLRAIFGALLGAILTLIIHPISRPFILGAFESSRNPSIRAKAQLPSAFPKQLPKPDTALAASIWIHVAAERIYSNDPLTKREVRALIQLAKKWVAKDPGNAFWRFAVAIFYQELREPGEAQKAWISASRCIRYDDLQSDRLEALRRQISSQFLPGSWQYAYVYRLRSLAFAALVGRYASDLAMSLGRVTVPDLLKRYATMINGSLLREGSRSLAIMQSGIAIVEVASHPRELRNETSIKRLLIAHSEFKEALKKWDLKEEANRVENIYNDNDAWSALSRREDTDENVSLLTFESSLLPTLPGAMLLVAGVGFVSVLVSRTLKFLAGKSDALYLGFVLGFGLVVAALVLFLTRSILALLAASFACGFVLAGPAHIRKRPPEGLGPLFTFANFMLACTFVVFLSIFFLCRTIPVVANIEAFNVPIEFLTNADLMAGLSLFIVAMIYLISPLWAMAQRIKTSSVLIEAFRLFGILVMTLGLVLTVVSTPICIYYENQTQPILKNLVANEPGYYVGR